MVKTEKVNCFKTPKERIIIFIVKVYVVLIVKRNYTNDLL